MEDIKAPGIQPLGDKVLLKVIAVEEQTSGGIFLPGSAAGESNRAEVVAVGPGKISEDGTLQPMQVKVGDKVIFTQHACLDLKFEKVDYKVTAEKDILFIIV